MLGMVNSREFKNSMKQLKSELQHIRDVMQSEPNHKTNGAKSPKASR
jgi:hypothetical protein